jgi:hypothetical protein
MGKTMDSTHFQGFENIVRFPFRRSHGGNEMIYILTSCTVCHFMELTDDSLKDIIKVK